MANDIKRKRPLLRREDKWGVADFQPDTDWHTLPENRDGWRQFMFERLVWKAVIKKKLNYEQLTHKRVWFATRRFTIRLRPSVTTRVWYAPFRTYGNNGNNHLSTAQDSGKRAFSDSNDPLLWIVIVLPTCRRRFSCLRVTTLSAVSKTPCQRGTFFTRLTHQPFCRARVCVLVARAVYSSLRTTCN